MTTFKTSRHIAATPSAIFAAFRDPERLARWWGPDGFTNQFKAFEFQPGGKWVFDMVGPDGTIYPNESVFTRIEPDRQVTIEHLCPPHFSLTIGLEPAPEGTLLQWTQTFIDASVASAIRHIVEPANEQNINRLSQEVA
ncbi:SRPBCC domain-containing protein [Roseateles koreensis]|uniref:SRPBCC domain-containing protein n=1 Tax=Roseateles koreensis TaxID=2987526 RepID=A0ABT5KYC1_9BURK|nr:SRPBCC domain-containing protein [Roseateles koreensis]MDC8786801.1 SRPBCC domain-containing protein [Roseateles koreensis]